MPSQCKHDASQIILLTKSLINSSLFPQSPPLWKGCLLFENPLLGESNLNGHKKLLASLKCGPTDESSWSKSSTQIIPCLPSYDSMIWFEVSGILCAFTFP